MKQALVGAYIPSSVEGLKLSTEEFRVLSRIARRTNGFDRIFNETVENVARACQVGERTVKAAYRKLIAVGAIERIGRGRHRATTLVKRWRFYISSKLDDLELSPIAFKVLCYCIRKFSKRPRQKSREEIARACGVSVASVKRALRELLLHNTISVSPVPGQPSVLGLISADRWRREPVDPSQIPDSDRTPMSRSGGREVGSNPVWGSGQIRHEVGSPETHKGIEKGIESKEHPLCIPPRGEEEIQKTWISGNGFETKPSSPQNSKPESKQEKKSLVNTSSFRDDQVDSGLSPKIDLEIPESAIDNPSMLRQLRERQRIVKGRPTQAARNRHRQESLQAKLDAVGVEKPEFLHWLLEQMKGWSVSANTVVDLNFARRTALKWASVEELNESLKETQVRLEGNDRLDRYIRQFVESRRAEEQRRAEAARIQAEVKAATEVRPWTLEELNALRAEAGQPPLDALPTEPDRRRTRVLPAGNVAGGLGDVSLPDF